MYRISVVCSVKRFTCYIEEELHMKSILYDVQLLATLTLSAKCPTLNCDSSVRFGRANFADRSENFRTEVLICVIMKLFLWLLQIVAEMVRNLVMAYVYCISKLVGNISYGRCGVIQDVCYGSRM